MARFSRLPPDGLANLGLVLYTLPVALVAMSASKSDFPYFQTGDYYHRHASYFWLSVIILAAVCFLLLLGIEKWWTRRRVKQRTAQ